MMKEDTSVLIKKTTLMGLALLFSLTLLVAGCTQQAAAPQPVAPPSIPDDGNPDQDSTEPDDTEIEVQDVDMEREDTKSEEEKVDDQIEQILPDGTHVDQVTYPNPSGQDSFEISITTEADIITAISLTPLGEPHQVSLGKMQAVDGALPDLVIGVNIAEVDLPRNVAGSSLTTAAVQRHIDSLVA